MKQQMTVQALAAEVQRQKHAKRDFIATTNSLTLVQPGPAGGWRLELDDGAGAIEAFEPTGHAHRQIGDRLQIPVKYYERMKADNPQLLAANVNSWFRNTPERRMVRTLDGRARAFLSDRYRRIDHYDLMDAVLPVLAEAPDMRIESAALTDTHMYVKALFPTLEGEVSKGDVVQFGVCISNSEIGAGAVDIAPLVMRLVCNNGMILPDARVRKNHVGRAIGGGEAYELFSDEALEADDRALLLKVRDLVRATTTEDGTRRLLSRLQDAAGERFGVSPGALVEELSNQNSLSKSESDSIMLMLIEGHDLSRWGLANAVTATARVVESYDRATALERLGGAIMDRCAFDERALDKAA
jgi:hypothetical protein